MAYITRFGGFWGQLPQTTGSIFFVAGSDSYTVEGRAYSASDNNDGLSPERALRTISQAVTNATASVGDVIVVLPGSNSFTASQAINKAGITVTGVPRGPRDSAGARMNAAGFRNTSSVVTSASDEIFNVTAADVEIAYLHLTPTAGFAAIDGSSAANRLYVHDCTFDMSSAENTATMGLHLLSTSTGLVYRNNFTLVSGNQGPAIRIIGATTDSVIESSTFYLKGATAWDDAIELTTTSLGNLFRDLDFHQSAVAVVITDCLEVAGATTDGATQIYRCFFPVGADAIEPANAADINVIENYIAQTGGGSGGILVAG
jgi:hypothetical protein